MSTAVANARPQVLFSDDFFHHCIFEQEVDWNLAELRSAFESVRAKPPAEWGQSRGPAGAVLLPMKRIGWIMSGPFSIKYDLGREWSLTSDAPVLIVRELKLAWGRKLSSEVGAKMGTGEQVSCEVALSLLKKDKDLCLGQELPVGLYHSVYLDC